MGHHSRCCFNCEGFLYLCYDTNSEINELLCFLLFFLMVNVADSANESTESDDEFQICEICNTEEVKVF